MRSVAGYVTNNNRERDRKEAQKGADKNLKEENLNRLLAFYSVLRNLQSFPTASARWLILFFCPSLISAKVCVKPSGTKTGS